MVKLYLGQNGSGKTSTIKNHISQLQGKVIILDFHDQYDEFAENVIYVDDVNPYIDPLCVKDVQALNAGYEKDTQCLWRKSEDLIREKFPKEERPTHDIESLGLVEEALERLQISWDATENSYARIFQKKIPFKKQKRHVSMKETLRVLEENEMILIRTRNARSEHLRAICFLLISRLSRTIEEPFYVVGDDLSSFFNHGNLVLLEKTMNPEMVEFIVSFNKAGNIPKKILEKVDTYFIHRFDNNSEIKELKKIITLPKNVKTLPVGQYVEFLA